MTTTDAAGPESIQDVIAKAVWHFSRMDDEIDDNVSAHAMSLRIQAALESAGYEIRQRAGVVEIPLEDALALRLELMSPRVVRRNEAVQHRLERAIARASGDGQT
jgi:hypothetical protein